MKNLTTKIEETIFDGAIWESNGYQNRLKIVNGHVLIYGSKIGKAETNCAFSHNIKTMSEAYVKLTNWGYTFKK